MLHTGEGLVERAEPMCTLIKQDSFLHVEKAGCEPNTVIR